MIPANTSEINAVKPRTKCTTSTRAIRKVRILRMLKLKLLLDKNKGKQLN